MASRISQVAVGVALYVVFVLSLYALSRIAFPDGGGPIPLWFASAQILFEASTSVIPGFLVGWLSRERGLMLGATVGAIGAILGSVAQLYMWGVPSLGWFDLRIVVGLVSALLAASVTNAVGGLAGAALHNQLKPSNPPLNRTRADNARAS